jgi:hypothetical protein
MNQIQYPQDQICALLDQAEDFLRNADARAAVARSTEAMRLVDRYCPTDVDLRDKVTLVRDRCLLCAHQEQGSQVERSREHRSLEAWAQVTPPIEH